MSSSLLNITLPNPIVLPTLQLTGLYACVLGLDYILLRNQNNLVFISKNSLRIAMTITHAIIPLTVVSPLSPNNVTFAAVPWFLASYSSYLPTQEFTLKEWLRSLYDTIVDREADHHNIQRSGLIKAGRGLLKLAVLYFGIDPLLPTMPDQMLQYPWLSQKSLMDTFLFGIKAYLVLGVVDVTTGVAQAVTGWCMVDMFDSPLLATSPIDFWSKRWNKTIRNLLHAQVFTSNHTPKDEKKKPVGFLSTNAGRGLLSFIVSGAFHELIICSVCRKLTLENFCFFSIHGLACMLESKYFNKKKPTTNIGKVSRIACQLGFMVLTGRLFLAPFLRHKFTEILPLTF
ncbi:hypothetical protein EDC94DRAFT_620738 [Helicostylum pulchrum]|nr:hypothetical protein EDC94DRAFT_620738 [Helicostylum pulchrum]